MFRILVLGYNTSWRYIQKRGTREKTGTFSGKRISKSSRLIRLIGAIDELNSFLGVIKSFSNDSNHWKIIEEIQSNFFTINSILSGSRLKFTKIKTTKLERQIDKWEKILPPQKNFIFYGGSKEASLVFYARALARCAERSLVSFAKKEKVSDAILMYFNRLSDYLFVLGRYINFKGNIKEEAWRV